MRQKNIIALFLVIMSIIGIFWIPRAHVDSSYIHINENEPFGFHPAVVANPRYSSSGYSDAENIGVCWSRHYIYAFWFIIQPDLTKDEYDFHNHDRFFGEVPDNINILGNITADISGRGRKDAKHEHYMKKDSYEPVDIPKYEKFVKATVERYDGDGIDDMPGLTNPVKYWQVDNEPPRDGKKDFAVLQEITYKAIKSACPDCQVMIGGASGFPDNFDKNFRDYTHILEDLNGEYIDIFDLHWYGTAFGEYRDLGDSLEIVKNTLTENGFENIPIWITEMGAYSGDPKDMRDNTLPPQTEQIQAGDYLKRYIYPISIGVEKIFPAFGLIEGFKQEDGYFDHTGLIYDGRLSDDLGLGVKKLGYWTYKLMTETLTGSDWDTLKEFYAEDNIYAYKIIKDNEPLWIVWWDWFDEKNYEEGDVKNVSIQLDGLSNAASLKITETAPDAKNCLNLKDEDYPNFFKSWNTKSSSSGNIDLELGLNPVFIKEVQLTELPPNQSKTVTPVYVTIYSHNEQDGYWKGLLDNKQEYIKYRDNLIEKVELIKEYGAKLNWQSDYVILQTIKKYDKGEMLDNTNGKNIARWMTEDMGVVVDPHGHVVEYNYADIAFLIKELGVNPSSVVGGFTIYKPAKGEKLVEEVDWKQILQINSSGEIDGKKYPGYTWKPVVLTQGAMIGHFFDECSSGVWRPDTKVGSFHKHDKDGDFIYIGTGYPHLTENNGTGIRGGATIKYDKAGYIKELAEMISTGEAPPDKIYTASVHIRDMPTVQPEGVDTLDGLRQTLEILEELKNNGQIIYLDYEGVADVWKQRYDSEPNRFGFENFSVYDEMASDIKQKPTTPRTSLLSQVSPFAIHNPVFNQKYDCVEDGQDIGVRWTRYCGMEGIVWDMIENKEPLGKPSNYDWSKTDRIATRMVEGGINILWTINQFNAIDQNEKKPNGMLPKDLDAYSRFLEATVERYDGDGIDDADGSPIVTCWQIHNEVDLKHFWSDTPENYALLLKTSYDVIKSANPSAKVAIGGMSGLTGIDFYNKILAELSRIGGTFDIFDFHWYGYVGDYNRQHWKGSKYSFKEFTNDYLPEMLDGFKNVEVWITEDGTYSGSDIKTTRGLAPAQSEHQQACELLKRYVYPLANNVKKIFWPDIQEQASYSRERNHNDYFDNNGLVYNGCGEKNGNFYCNPDEGIGDDLGEGVKKLSYWTYKQMTEKLEGSDWENIETIQESNNIYIFKFKNKINGESIWVVWNDSDDEESIILNLDDVSSVKITDAVPRFEAGIEVTDFNTAFNSKILETTNGTLSFPLNKTPVFIEVEKYGNDDLDEDETILKFQIDKKEYFLNDRSVVIDVAPIIQNGRTLLPARFVTEPLGGDVSWDGTEKKVVCALGETTVELWIGKPTAKVNGMEVQIDPNNPDVTPTIIDDRTMVPMRFLAESLGCEVEWIADTKEIILTYSP